MIKILGIETSCDETAAAVVRDGRYVLSNVVASQADLHARWGGVVPEVASRKHVEATLPVIYEALAQAEVTFADIDAIAVTNRPGLVGALLVGVSAAKGLAYALHKPLLGVHHLEGHLYSAFLADPTLEFPFLCLLVSGGHTELILIKGHDDKTSLGRTRDDAAGECYDKSARLMGLPYPGGPHIDRLAQLGDPTRIPFPRSRMTEAYDFSFSGLKTAVSRFMEEDRGKTPIEDVAASFQAAVVDVLTTKTLLAAKESGMRAISVCGGVAANQGLKAEMRRKCEEAGIQLVVPGIELCTDNAAMIAAAAHHRFAGGGSDGFEMDTFASAPLP